MNTEAILLVVFPLPIVLFIAVKPEHRAKSFLFVLAPFALIIVLRRVSHGSLSMLLSFKKISLIHSSRFEYQLSFSLPFTIFPLTLVDDI